MDMANIANVTSYLPVISKLADIGVTIVLTFTLVAILMWAIVTLRKTLENNTLAIKSVADAMISMTSTVTVLSGNVDYLSQSVNADEKIIAVHDERSSSIKDIVASTYDTAIDISRSMPSKDEIRSLHNSVNNAATKNDISDLQHQVSQLVLEVCKGGVGNG